MRDTYNNYLAAHSPPTPSRHTITEVECSTCDGERKHSHEATYETHSPAGQALPMAHFCRHGASSVTASSGPADGAERSCSNLTPNVVRLSRLVLLSAALERHLLLLQQLPPSETNLVRGKVHTAAAAAEQPARANEAYVSLEPEAKKAKEDNQREHYLGHQRIHCRVIKRWHDWWQWRRWQRWLW